MRALNIAVFIFIASLCMSTVSALMEGQTPPTPSTPVSQGDVGTLTNLGAIENQTAVQGDPTMLAFWEILLLPKYLGVFLKIITGAALLGSTVASLCPFPLPASIVVGLNALGLVCVAIAIIQFVLGRMLGGAE